MNEIIAKLGNMKKEKSWVVYPRKDGDPNIIIQTTDRIARFDATTGKGVLSKSKYGAGFAMLNPFMGAQEITVPENVIMSALGNAPRSGDEVGPGVRIA